MGDRVTSGATASRPKAWVEIGCRSRGLRVGANPYSVSAGSGPSRQQLFAHRGVRGVAAGRRCLGSSSTVGGAQRDHGVAFGNQNQLKLGVAGHVGNERLPRSTGPSECAIGDGRVGRSCKAT